MGSKKIESKVVTSIFEKLRTYSKEKRKQILNDIEEGVVNIAKKHPERKRNKANIERTRSEVFRLLKEYDDEVSKQERKELFEKFEEYREAIERSIIQWQMGLYQDLTRKNILGYVDMMELTLLKLAWALKYELNENNKTPISPYPDDIIDVIDEFQYIIPKAEKEIKTFNKIVAETRGLHDAIEILIGKKPEERIIKEVREVILTVREKPKPQPRSTKFICFNCDKEYDKPIKICEKCGFEFKKKR